MNGYDKATFAGRCFWCMETVFKKLDSVVEVVSGYANGGSYIQGCASLSSILSPVVLLAICILLYNFPSSLELLTSPLPSL